MALGLLYLLVLVYSSFDRGFCFILLFILVLFLISVLDFLHSFWRRILRLLNSSLNIRILSAVASSIGRRASGYDIGCG